MNNTKLRFLVAAALMGLSHTAQAEAPSVSDGKFTPLEQLSTDQRSQYQQLIRELMRNVRIDWNSVILGIDENGTLVIRARKPGETLDRAEPSCWTLP